MKIYLTNNGKLLLISILLAIIFFILSGCSSIKQTTDTKENTTIKIEDKNIPVPGIKIDLPAQNIPDIDTSLYIESYQAKDDNVNLIITKDKKGKVKVKGDINPPPVQYKDTTIIKEKTKTITNVKEPGFFEKLWITIKGIWYLIALVAIIILAYPFVKRLI